MKSRVQGPTDHAVPFHYMCCSIAQVLEEATDGFATSNLLGEGGFGAVFRGKFRDGTDIAVKVVVPSSLQNLGSSVLSHAGGLKMATELLSSILSSCEANLAAQVCDVLVCDE